jgi:hypothetical protein
MTENKQPEDMTSDERAEVKIEFAPGAFDTFNGSQEELDTLIAEIKNMILDGSLFEKTRSVDIDELMESDNPEDRSLAMRLLRAANNDLDDRNLQ